MAEISPETRVDRLGRPFVIRTAQPADAAGMLAYLQVVFADNEFFPRGADEVAYTEEWEQNWLEEQRTAPGSLLLVAEADTQIIASLGFQSGPYRRIAHRGSMGISVLPAWRGAGIGTALMTRFLTWAEEHPLLERVSLEVLSTNPRALELYRKLGFIEDGRRPRDIRFESGRYADMISMHRWLKQPNPPKPHN